MSEERIRATTRFLLLFMVAYAVTSLFHYAHNAELLSEYPNMPPWLSRSQVYGAWLGVTSIGVVGYLLTRSRYPLAGLAVLSAYGLLGLDGLGHYAIAPLSDHTLTMHATIWLEAGAALLLLAAIARVMLSATVRR